MVRTDAAAIYAVGKTWLQVPPVAKVTLTGVMPPGVSGKDAIITLIGMLNNDEVLNHSIEFVGSEETYVFLSYMVSRHLPNHLTSCRLRSIPIDFRLTMSNKTTEWGCLSAIWPIDSVLISWLRANATTSAMLNPELGEQARFNHKRIDELVQNPVAADPGATYAKSYYLNLSTLSPIVSGPNSVKIATPVRELEAQKVPINKA